MPYLTADELKTIIVDFTSYCNAMCGNCSRNINGVEINPRMPLSHMSTKTWKKIFRRESSIVLDEVIFNGSYGDPIFNPSLLEALDHLKTLRIIPTVSIHTNGGLGTKELFKDLAIMLKNFPFPSHITFSIDGLEDTNHLYRRNVVWKKVIENAETFIEHGGIARWRMLIFKHNEHQVDECRKLSESMGFKKFDINGGHSFSAINSIISRPVEFFEKNKKEEKRTVEYAFLDQKERIENLIEKHDNIKTAIQDCDIKCKWKAKKKIQISHTGLVFPCCYFLSDLYSRNPDSVFAKDVNSIVNEFGKNWNDVNHYTVEEILSHQWFSDHLPNSWSGDRYEICAVSCGY